jgi:hypothetical protein
VGVSIDGSVGGLVDFEKLVTERLGKRSTEDKPEFAFMPAQLVQVSLPYRQQSGHVFERTSGNYSLRVVDNGGEGLPYGVIPRLFLLWLTTEVFRRKSRTIDLGKSFRIFLASMGYFNVGGNETARIKDQLRRLVSAAINFRYAKDGEWISVGFFIVEKLRLVENSDDIPFKGEFIVSERFFEECRYRCVPTDMNAVRLLRHSPLAIDIYIWLSYKNFVLQKPAAISWKALKAQFGSQNTPVKKFKQTFCKQLEAVKRVYPDAAVVVRQKDLLVLPSKPVIAPREIEEPSS